MSLPVGVLFYDPRAKPTSVTGTFQPGCYYQFYLTGTTTLANVYADGLLTTPLSQTPLTGGTTAASDGRLAPIYMNPSTIYRVQLYSAAGALLEDTDPFVTSGGSFAAGDIRNYGGVVNVDATSAITADAAANHEVVFPAGAWVINSLPTIPTGVILTAQPGATFTGAGAAVLGFAISPIGVPGYQTIEFTPAGGNELATRNIFRNASASGGTPGQVNTALRIQSNVGANVAQYEWAFLSILNNSATAGQNAAFYAQGNKLTGAGPTWGGVFQANDKSGNANPTSQLVALELDLFADGGDSNAGRVILDLVGGIGVSVAPTITYGQRIGPFNGVNANCLYLNGLYFRGAQTRSINITSTGAVGIDISSATLSAAAVRLGSTQYLSFDSGDARTFGYVAADSALEMTVSGNAIAKFFNTGALQILPTTAVPAGGAAGTGLTFSTTANLGIFFGSGAPSFNAAQGSLYIRTDGSGANNRAYIAKDSVGTWTPITTST